jgi:hypothetical protein
MVPLHLVFVDTQAKSEILLDTKERVPGLA